MNQPKKDPTIVPLTIPKAAPSRAGAPSGSTGHPTTATTTASAEAPESSKDVAQNPILYVLSLPFRLLWWALKGIFYIILEMIFN